MHILLLALSILGGLAFWIYRLRDLGHAAGQAVDTAQRVRGAYRRKKFRQKAESSPIATVDDPASAAVAMLIALASSKGGLTPVAEAAIKHEITENMALPKPEEVYAFSHWVAGHTDDPNNLSLRFARLWLDALDGSERLDFYRMAERVVALDGEPSAIQTEALRRLKDRLAI